MTIAKSSTLTDIAYAVCTALDRVGTRAILTGGSAATFYAPEAYESKDLDFVIEFKTDRQAAAKALAKLGFTLDGQSQTYAHPRTHFTLDFPKGPLGIGDERITSYTTHKRKDEILYVLSATDSIRDRLTHYLFGNDFQALKQAVDVYGAQSKNVDLEVIRRWCHRERQSEKFDLFRSRIAVR
jgi:hypothetical protein